MKTYKITIAHDNGTIALRATARTKQMAIEIVMASENCPSCAILSIKQIY